MFDTSSLARLRPGVRRLRASTWDRSGGNDDAVALAPGETRTLAEDDGAGQVTHVWATLLTPNLYWGRDLVLRMHWDGETHPSVEAPFGDFFGVGNCLPVTYSSALLEAAPRAGLSLHCWFPMPFAEGFRITVENQSTLPVPSLYCHVDYERWPQADPSLGRFHAWWNRRRGPGIAGPEHGTYEPGHNASADDNYLIMASEGRGHYVGAFLNVHSAEGGWYGEGDDMVLIDADDWPPAVHGTGTEDAFGSAWSPAERFAFPRYGQPVADRQDWSGFSSVYRFHLSDPMPFERSIRVTIEQGHANDRRDDWSSVAYWYQAGRTDPLPPLPGREQRLPCWPQSWRRRAEAIQARYLEALRDPAAVPNWDGHRAAVQQFMLAVHDRDWGRIDDVLGWLVGDGAPKGTGDDPGSDPRESLAAWSAGFDAEEAGDAEFTIGFEVQGPDGVSSWRLVVRDGGCTLAEGRRGHERMTIATDTATLARFTSGELDGWEAVVRGLLRVRGDSSLALRIPAIFRIGRLSW